MTAFPLERFLGVRKTHSPSFGPEGDRLAVLFDATGTLQAWVLDGPGTWPRQRTFGDDRVTFAAWSPTRHEFAFGRDAGGDGNTQLYVARESGRTDRLTDTPGASHRWGGWDPAGDRFAFAANRRSDSSFDVYVQRRDAEAADPVYETGGWFDVLGWAPDGERLLLRETHASLEHDLHVLDVEAGEARHLTPFDGTARYKSVNWGPDGEAVYLVTDLGADTQYLARVRIGDSGRETADVESASVESAAVERRGVETVVDGGDWNVDGLALHPETGRLAYGRNVDGYTEVTVGELDGEDGTTDGIRTFPEPDLPDGVVGEVSFTPDAERFATTVTTRARPPTVYVVTVETGAAERWTAPSRGAIPEEVFVRPDLVHVESFDGLAVPAFFSVPRDAERGETPVVVDLHGGPESQRRPSFDYVRPYLLDRGYAVLEPNVRGSTGYGKEYASLDDRRKRTDAVRDVLACAEWVADRDVVAPDRVAVLGKSYGGFLALSCLARRPDRWAAGATVAGITDLVTFLENTGSWRRDLREEEYGSLADDREFLESISPAARAGDVAAPLLAVHGENDPRVPVADVLDFVERVREGGTTAEALVLDEEGHGISHRRNRVLAYRRLVEFLDEHVGV